MLKNDTKASQFIGNKMTCQYYINRLYIINAISLIGGIITAISGATSMPQTVTNNGDKYFGDADSYNADLKKAQLASNGFKVVIIGLSITAFNFIALLGMWYYPYLQEYSHENLSIHPQPIQVDQSQRRVTISPTVTEIPGHTISVDKSKNIKKWVGNAVMPEHII